MNILFYDTETTGFANRSRPLNHPSQPYATQLGYIYEEDQKIIETQDSLIKPFSPDFEINPKAQEITGITKEMCEEQGLPLADIMGGYDQKMGFIECAKRADFFVAHNAEFDERIVTIQMARLFPDLDPEEVFQGKPHICTMKPLTFVCKIPKKDKRTGWKWPKLEEAYEHFFGEKLEGAHDAMVDIMATRRLFDHCFDLGIWDKSMKAAGLERFLGEPPVVGK